MHIYYLSLNKQRVVRTKGCGEAEVTCRASRRSYMPMGGRGAGALEPEQANRKAAFCSASSGDT